MALIKPVTTVTVQVRWHVLQIIPKSLFKDGELERSIASDCIHEEEKKEIEGFPENGCSGNQPRPFLGFFLIALTVTIPAILQNKT